MAGPDPLVSVVTITYQHEPYIGQAIASVLMQRTTFPFELVLGEDGSADRTLEICRSFQRERPDVVRLVENGGLPKAKVGGRVTGVQNFARTLPHTRGKYVALLEGDDYWIASDKLQRQVDFLEANPDHAFCFTGVLRLRSDGTVLRPAPRTSRWRFETKDLLARPIVPTASVVYRREAMPIPLPDWFVTESPIGDYPLAIVASRWGPGRRLEGRTAVYRVGSGLWSTRRQDSVLRDVITTREVVARKLPDLAPELLRLARLDRYQLALALFARGERAEGSKVLAEADAAVVPGSEDGARDAETRAARALAVAGARSRLVAQGIRGAQFARERVGGYAWTLNEGREPRPSP